MQRKYVLQECNPEKTPRKWSTIAKELGKVNAYWLCGLAERSGVGNLYRVEEQGYS